MKLLLVNKQIGLAVMLSTQVLCAGAQHKLYDHARAFHDSATGMLYSGERHGRGGNWSKEKKAQSYREDYRFIYDNLLRKPFPELYSR